MDFFCDLFANCAKSELSEKGKKSKNIQKKVETLVIEDEAFG